MEWSWQVYQTSQSARGVASWSGHGKCIRLANQREVWHQGVVMASVSDQPISERCGIKEWSWQVYQTSQSARGVASRSGQGRCIRLANQREVWHQGVVRAGVSD